ncbi:hypothetical protein PoB_005781600 [Plakobranchus ocellatus]|uniref:Uncharacterized protein n=1 Tax=Plakobranchus ocellatus TaxID=259542 RepID=A0AAV4CEW3_9GAST|nr:hypothetical protein PoB_005781600 [Plakobranchus ocellatus]
MLCNAFLCPFGPLSIPFKSQGLHWLPMVVYQFFSSLAVLMVGTAFAKCNGLLVALLTSQSDSGGFCLPQTSQSRRQRSKRLMAGQLPLHATPRSLAPTDAIAPLWAVGDVTMQT